MDSIHTQPISFGDCDPAGLAFYPNAFRWMDAAFHAHLRRFGGHAEICRHLGALGLGLVDASAQFRSPMRDGDCLEMTVAVAEWSARSFTVRYGARVGDRIAFTAREIRCMFRATPDGLAAGEVGALRRLLEESDDVRRERAKSGD